MSLQFKIDNEQVWGGGQYPPWDSYTPSGSSIIIQSALAKFSGTQGLRVDVTGTDKSVRLQKAITQSLTYAASFRMRRNAWTPTGTPTCAILECRQDVLGQATLYHNQTATGPRLLLQVRTTGTPDSKFVATASDLLVDGAWHLIEVTSVCTATENTGLVWVDGNLVITNVLAGDATTNKGSYIRFGGAYVYGTLTAQFDLDDLFVGTARSDWRDRGLRSVGRGIARGVLVGAA